MKVTVIIPCFHNESTISDVLADIRCQTCSDWELLVVGNGPCQEAQRKIVEAAASEDGRIKYLSIEEAGVSRARNLGIEKASGAYERENRHHRRVGRTGFHVGASGRGNGL